MTESRRSPDHQGSSDERCAGRARKDSPRAASDARTRQRRRSWRRSARRTRRARPRRPCGENDSEDETTEQVHGRAEVLALDLEKRSDESAGNPCHILIVGESTVVHEEVAAGLDFAHRIRIARRRGKVQSQVRAHGRPPVLNASAREPTYLNTPRFACSGAYGEEHVPGEPVGREPVPGARPGGDAADEEVAGP